MFKKSERKQVKLKLAITGASGSGKTFSALLLAKGLANGGKVAVIDTENGSASLYSDMKDGPLAGMSFDDSVFEPPFTTEKYLDAITYAEKNGYSVIVIDSLTHAWAGEGGLLEQKEQLDARGKGNSYTNWASITKKHETFKSSILHSNIHVIATMRSKQEYILQESNGKQVPKKVGMAPIQRDGMEYEFTTVFDLASNNSAEASKDRTAMFAGKIFTISEETGKQFLAWLESGSKQDDAPKKQEPIQNSTPKPAINKVDPDTPLGELFRVLEDWKWSKEQAKEAIKAVYGKEKSGDLTIDQIIDFTRAVKQYKTFNAAMAAALGK